MATIIEVKLPDEYKDKNKYEIYTNLEKVATYAHNLKEELTNLKAEIKLRDAQLQKQRADILKLKSLVGYKNIAIKDLQLEAEDVIDITETTTPNFLPPSVKFHEVTQELKK
tara:strand:- start:458 stop:793 length:336 start_codon:yes stop_codon:yes gene_type:complete